MKNSKKTGITGNENESTTTVGSQEMTVNTVVKSSTDKKESDSIDVKSMNVTEGSSSIQEEVIDKLQELDETLNSIIPENSPYKKNLKDLEFTINHLKRRINNFKLELYELIFDSGLMNSDILINVYNDFMEKSDNLLQELFSLQNKKKFCLNEQIVHECTSELFEYESSTLNLQKKKKYMNNEHLNRFLSLVKEYKPVLSVIYKKVLDDNEIDDFFRNKLNKVSKINDKVYGLYQEVKTIIKKSNVLSISNRYMYDQLNMLLESTRRIPERLDNITLSEEKGFDTNESEFLEIFEEFCDMDFVLDNYDIDELKNGISLE